MSSALSRVAVVVALVAAPSLAGARGPYGPGSAFRPDRIDALAAEVGVDATTVATIKDLAFKSEQAAIGLRTGLQQAEKELMALIEQSDPDQTAVMRQVEELGRIETELRKNRVQLLLNVRALLNAEQRQRLKALVRDRPGRGGPGGIGCAGLGAGPGADPGADVAPGPKGQAGQGGRQRGKRGPR